MPRLPSSPPTAVNGDPSKPGLVRAIGRWSLTALVLNGIIGSGIFGLPGSIAKLLGPAAPWAYLFAAAGTGVIMAVFAELSSQYRETGGQYLYARDALGRLAGIQVGWFFWLARLTSGAAVASLFVVYLGEFWPGATSPLARAAVIAAIVGGLAVVNFRGVRAGAGLSSVFTVAKLVPLGLFIIAGLWLVESRAVPRLATPATAGQWFDALIALVFAYGGAESAMIPGAEAKNPRRDAPFALLAGLAVVTVCYLLVHLVAMWALPELAQSERPLADAARVFAGPVGAAVIALGVLLSTYGWLSGASVTAPRLTYAMAERGDFPRAFAAVHPRFRTPHVSIVLWAVLVLVLALYGSFIWNAILSVAARLVTYAASCAALIQLRRRNPEADAWRAPAGNFLAVLGIVLCALLASRLTVTHAAIMAVVAAIATANWLAVRGR